jgi:propanol-preferring alcohol dehydrogenase
MTTMPAYRLLGWGEPARFVDVDVPDPRHGEALVRVAGVGLCHSDIYMMEAPASRFPFMKPPFTLGHENAGWVEALGPGTDGEIAVGDAVLVDSHYICGRCDFCRRGHDNYCVQAMGNGQGAGVDGGLATFLVARVGNLVRLRSLDARVAGPLADAGRTSYHVVKKALPKLLPGSTAIVIGAGGLGGFAIQWLSMMTTARIVVADVAPHRLSAARELGAHEAVLSDARVVDELVDATEGRKAEAVFDFVGTDATIATALAVARPMSTFALVGAGGGTASIAWGQVALECEVFIPLGGSHVELHEVVRLAEQDRVRLDVEQFNFDRLEEAYDRLRTGDLSGRAVVLPNG